MEQPRLGFSRLKKGALALALAGAMAAGGVGTAFAADAPFGDNPTGHTTADSNLLTTYGVRAGSAGADYLGITNTNFDFTAGSASSPDQFAGFTSSSSAQLAGLSIWATSVNENVNPYYANLLYHAVTGTATTDEATTWMSNPETSSWGDSNGSASQTPDGTATIAGLEYSPDIIFGANKMTNWEQDASGQGSGTNIYAATSADASYDPTFVTNDATNLWSQIYTMGQLATAADGLSVDGQVTRYNGSDAQASALAYERAIRGNLLYVASQIDAGNTAERTVAYLYAIDADGTGYFFTPTASGLLNGDDTGKTATSAAATADDNYAANNSTINMGYMATLPFISNTYDSGNAFAGGIVMKVEDIFKTNPACTVGSSDSLAGVDTIIFNTTTQTNLDGTSGGKNSSGVNNDYLGNALSASEVSTWAAAHGFAGEVVAGDDFGTSSNQGYNNGTAVSDAAPLLYCQRNYTADKDTRAAWAFSKVYPELYGDNADATYGYWVDNVYHVNTDDVATVVGYMTGRSADAVEYDEVTAAVVEDNAEIGYSWWTTTGQSDPEWSAFAYYNGSSRASYYSGNASSEQAANTIGIFAPSALWTSAH